MENLVIFSTPWIMVILLVCIILNVICAIIRKILGDNASTQKIVSILSIIILALHLAMIVLMFSMKVTPEEIFFILAVSSSITYFACNAGKKGE